MPDSETTAVSAVLPAITDSFKEQLWKRFQMEGVQRGERTRWYERVGQEYGVKPTEVQRWIAQERDREFLTGPEAQRTALSRLLEEAGMGRMKACAALADALEAETITVAHDRDGKAIDEQRTPDHRTRILAAEKLLKLHGDFRDQLEVSRGAGFENMSDDELDKVIEARGQVIE